MCLAKTAIDLSCRGKQRLIHYQYLKRKGQPLRLSLSQLYKCTQHVRTQPLTATQSTDSSTDDEFDSSSSSTQYGDEEIINAPTQEPYFIVDSGASSNMADKDLIKHLANVEQGLPYDLAIAGIGGKTMTATAEANCGEHRMTFFEGLGCNILSVHQLYAKIRRSALSSPAEACAWSLTRPRCNL